MKKLILYYLYAFLMLDVFMGFLLLYLGLQGTLVLNPGQIVRGILLLLLFAVLIKDALKRLNSMNSRILATVLYFLLFVVVIYVKNDPGLHGTVELNNVAKLAFLILLFYYVHKHKDYFIAHLDKIMLVNFWVLTANLLVSYLSGLGISTYGSALSSTKGFLYGGNAVSILSLVFFAFYFFKIKTEPKAKYLCLLAVLDIYIVGTKAIFIVPVVVLIYLMTKVSWTPVKVAISAAVIIPVIIAGIIVVQPLIYQAYQSKYSRVLQNQGLLVSENGSGPGSLKQAFLAYRRTVFATAQIQHQFSDAGGLLFGYGNAGQNMFWNNKAYGGRFTFAAMDFVDFLFEYGIIGSLLFYSFIFYAFYFVIKEWQFTAVRVSFVFIFLYSFFGGYVLFGLTAGTMFAFLLAMVYPQRRAKPGNDHPKHFTP